MADPLHTEPRRRIVERRSSPARTDTSDVDELIRVSNRLHRRSHAVQQAAVRASAVFQEVLRRSLEVCGK